MKKSTIVIILSVLVMVPMFLLTMSIRENKAEQQTINAVPAIPDGETRASEWGKHYPRQYDTFMQTRKSDEIGDVLKDDPNIVILWAGYAFSKDYNKPRGHYYALEDNINTLRTGAPVDAVTGPQPTACWTCKSPDVPRVIKRDGEMEYFTGKWAKYGDEIVNPIGCGDCHNNKTMQLTLSRDYLKRALDAEGSLKVADVTRTCAPWSAPSATSSTTSRRLSGTTRVRRRWPQWSPCPGRKGSRRSRWRSITTATASPISPTS